MCTLISRLLAELCAVLRIGQIPNTGIAHKRYCSLGVRGRQCVSREGESIDPNQDIHFNYTGPIMSGDWFFARGVRIAEGDLENAGSLKNMSSSVRQYFKDVNKELDVHAAEDGVVPGRFKGSNGDWVYQFPTHVVTWKAFRSMSPGNATSGAGFCFSDVRIAVNGSTNSMFGWPIIEKWFRDESHDRLRGLRALPLEVRVTIAVDTAGRSVADSAYTVAVCEAWPNSTEIESGSLVPCADVTFQGTDWFRNDSRHDHTIRVRLSESSALIG